jgi:glycosyltransferase involved in cell wall biosynthesis
MTLATLIGIDASRALRVRRTGTERYSLELIRHLLALPEAQAYRWRLYIDQPAEATFFFSTGDGGAPLVELCLLPARRLWTHRQLAGEVLRHPPDVLFIPAHVLPFVLPVWRLPPSVVTVHDLGYRHWPQTHPWRQRIYLDWGTQWNTLAATQLIAVSQATADDLQRFYRTPPRKTTVVYEAHTPGTAVAATAVAEVCRRLGLAQPYLLYVGTIQPRKNLARLLQAYAQLASAGRISCDLVLAGGQGWLAEPLAEQARQFGLANRVHFLGYVSEAELPALYQGAQAFCFPSLFEGFGLPVLEAQAYGVPVMTANNSSLPEIAGDAALLVDPTDVDAIAEAMLRLTQDEALRQRLIAAGQENVKRFSWEKAARETLAVLLKAAGRGN